MSAHMHSATTSQPAPIVRPHAHAVNATFRNKASNYQTLEQRLNYYQKDPLYDQMVQQALSHWRVLYPDITSWDQIVLGQARDAPLSRIQIDTTLQREVIVNWLCSIVQGFKALRVMPICVYQDGKQSRPDFYTCWDGQHTALTLWLIAVHVLKLDPDTCMVPVFVHPSTSREQMRENFTDLNGAAKKPVSKAEMFRQEVLGVRVDNSKRPAWLESEQKQKILERYSLFVIDEHNMLASQPGAITNMSELLATGKQGAGKRYSLAHLEQFCMLMNAAGLNRAVNSAEMWQWMDYFSACDRQQIKVDAAYVNTLAHVIQTCLGTFNGDVIHDKGKHVYMQWFKHERAFATGMATGQQWNNNRKQYHLYWLTHALKKWSKLQVPVVDNMEWPIASDYLELQYLQATE